MTMIGEPTSIVSPHGIRPGLNEGLTDIPENLFVNYNASALPHSVVLPSAGGPAMGVTGEVLKSGYYGDVQIRDRAIVKTAGTVLIGERVKTDAAGKALKATSGTYALGVCHAKGSSGDLIEVELLAVPAVEPS